MKVEDLVYYLDHYPTIHFLLDIRCDTKEDFVGFASMMHDDLKDYSKQIALMINGNQYYENCDIIDDEFTFIYRALDKESYLDVLTFCSSHNINTVCYNPSFFRAEDALPFFKAHGVNVLIYTENDAQIAAGYISLGAAGVFSDVITPKDLDIFR